MLPFTSKIHDWRGLLLAAVVAALPVFALPRFAGGSRRDQKKPNAREGLSISSR